MAARRSSLSRIGHRAIIEPMVGATRALGLAGLTAACKLEQAGFVVTRRTRATGAAAVWTLRDGEKVMMIDEGAQTARFSNGIDRPPGPARILAFRQGLLGSVKQVDLIAPVVIDSAVAEPAPQQAAEA